jgi:hypothetical protein
MNDTEKQPGQQADVTRPDHNEHVSGRQKTGKAEYSPTEGDRIEQGFEQMEMLYKSRCVAMSGRSNVTVTEIKKTRKQT